MNTLAEYYASIRKPESEWKSLEDVTPQLAEFEHYVQAGNYDAAAKLVNYTDTACLFRWGQYVRLVDMRTRLQRQLVNPILQMFNHGRLARAYHDQGKLEVAKALYQTAATLALENDAQRDRGVWMGYLGIAHFDQGQIDLAVQLYEQALEIARNAKDRYHESQWLGYLGACLSVYGSSGTNRCID